jgi:hypothetical protein
MKRLAGFLLWTVVFLVLLLAADQFLLRVPLKAPAYTTARNFYLDFRSGLLHPKAARKAAPAVSASRREKKRSAPARVASPEPTPRYVWVDGQGELRFADSLAEIPAAFRKEAKPLKR